jgi:5-formyltetrahydrofolate cyclo-ligase
MIKPLTASSTSSKQALRQQFRQARRELSLTDQNQAAQQLLTQMLTANLLEKQLRVAVYLSQDGEISCQALINWCWNNGVETYLPVLDTVKPGYLLFLPYTPQTPLVANQYGIPEPKLEPDAIISVTELCIVMLPLVAFDPVGHRLGMGGGFYDRTLSGKIRPDLVTSGDFPQLYGLAHDCQQAQKLHTDSWDIPLDKIITPSSIISISR